MRKAKESKNSLASKWNIVPDGMINGYSPHTMTMDTSKRKNTVVKRRHSNGNRQSHSRNQNLASSTRLHATPYENIKEIRSKSVSFVWKKQKVQTMQDPSAADNHPPGGPKKIRLPKASPIRAK